MAKAESCRESEISCGNIRDVEGIPATFNGADVRKSLGIGQNCTVLQP